ncbi:MAG: methylenetetrahydrofolate reductase [Rhodospirillaceae bacterium]
MSKLSQALTSGTFIITAEITPPLSSAPEDFLEKASILRGKVDAVNVTDGASARAHMSSLVCAGLLLQNDLEPILQFTCRDRNRIALQSDLLGASALGIENLLILRGDDPTAGDQPEARAVFDYESQELIECAAFMRDSGKLPSGREIKKRPFFVLGCADTPMRPTDPRWKPSSLQSKIRAGVHFIQTQFCFDIDIVKEYAASLRELGITEKAGVLIGIAPLTSSKSALWMRENLWGTSIPDHIIERIEKANDQSAEGTQICAELIAGYSEIKGISGVHIMAPIGFDAIPLAIKRSGLR